MHLRPLVTIYIHPSLRHMPVLVFKRPVVKRGRPERIGRMPVPHARNQIGMSRDSVDTARCSYIPYPYRVVLAGCRELVPIRRPVKGEDGFDV
jgi:hypothetical protein